MVSRGDGVCKVEGCQRPDFCKGYCNLHYQRMWKNGHLNRKTRMNGEGSIKPSGHIIIMVNGRSVLQHVLVAEKAVGHRLPEKAVVHHSDENPANNDPSNLVVCPDRAYHQLLHKRMRAFEMCGNANYLRCYLCKKYDDPKMLLPKSQVHKECRKIYNYNYHKTRNTENGKR